MRYYWHGYAAYALLTHPLVIYLLMFHSPSYTDGYRRCTIALQVFSPIRRENG